MNLLRVAWLFAFIFACLDLWSGNRVEAAWISVCVVVPGIVLFGFSLRRPRNRFLLKRHLRSKFGGNYVPSHPLPERTAEDVERIVKRDFPPEEYAKVMSILNEDGTESWQRTSPRVQLAVLKMANGSMWALRTWAGVAKSGYRDVLNPAEYPSSQKMGHLRVQGLPKKERLRITDGDWRQYEDWFNR
jgi:hypothetical protein